MNTSGIVCPMPPLLTILLASWLAGIASFVGGWLAQFFDGKETETKREVMHGIVAFGGGILLSAVALALVPVGMAELTPLPLALTFCLGGGVFCVVDAGLSRHGGSKAQLLAMLMDFLPEAISLGAVFGHDQRLGLLLALFIGAQNLPEGFNSFREMTAAGMSKRATLRTLFALSFLGPVVAWLGHALLQDRAQLTAGIMTFAGGGILYLIFQDIAPQSTMRRHWTPPLGAVLGFLMGMIGKQLLG